jgi:hypothetical protein
MLTEYLCDYSDLSDKLNEILKLRLRMETNHVVLAFLLQIISERVKSKRIAPRDFLPIVALEDLSRHEDYEIRTIIVQVLAAVYFADSALFYQKNLHEYVFKLAEDDSRFTRLAIWKFLAELNKQAKECSTTLVDDKQKSFQSWASSFDVDKEAQSCSPEYLYNGIEISKCLWHENHEIGQGNNILVCYDC